jgi:(p)ppGpp synthase/HD superfamily hydrolase
MGINEEVMLAVVQDRAYRLIKLISMKAPKKIIEDEIALLNTSDIVERARIFATAAHAAVKQKRKYTGEPYINHPAAVVKLVEGSIPHTPEMLAAAWLHDVVEDTGVDLETIRAEFGNIVAGMVEWLTDTPLEMGNRAQRKSVDQGRLADASPDVQTIKLADTIDNTSTIRERDPEFWEVYKLEKQQLLEVMNQGDPDLMKMAKEIINT